LGKSVFSKLFEKILRLATVVRAAGISAKEEVVARKRRSCFMNISLTWQFLVVCVFKASLSINA
jgi:hypothetical protein